MAVQSRRAHTRGANEVARGQSEQHLQSRGPHQKQYSRRHTWSPPPTTSRLSFVRYLYMPGGKGAYRSPVQIGRLQSSSIGGQYPRSPAYGRMRVSLPALAGTAVTTTWCGATKGFRGEGEQIAPRSPRAMATSMWPLLLLASLVALVGAEPVQLISGSGDFAAPVASSVASSLPGGSGVSVVASLGGNARGRRLLNAVFGTSFATELQLDGADEGSAGAWLAGGR